MDKNALNHDFELSGKTSPESRMSGLLKHRGDGANLRPVITCKTSVGQLRPVVRDESAGYDGTWRVRPSGQLVEIPDGNTDGYSSTLDHRGKGVIRGRSVSVGGWVWKNIFMTGVIDIAEISIGHEMAEEISPLGDSITNEFLIRFSPGIASLAV
jgi:alanine racemase